MIRDSRYPVGLVVMLAVLSWSAAAHAQFIRGFDLFRTGQYCEAREAWLASEK